MTTPLSYYFPGKNNSPRWIPTPCFDRPLHEVKSRFKEKHDCGTKTPNMCTEQKIIFIWYLKISKKSKFYNKIINKCDWTTLSRRNINIYVSAIEKLLSVDFSIKFASFLSLSQTKSVSLPSLIKWVQCHIFYFYYCYSEIIQIHAFYKQQKAEIGEKSSKC